MRHYRLNKTRFGLFMIKTILILGVLLALSFYLDILCNNIDGCSTYWFPWTTSFCEEVVARAG